MGGAGNADAPLGLRTQAPAAITQPTPQSFQRAQFNSHYFTRSGGLHSRNFTTIIMTTEQLEKGKTLAKNIETLKLWRAAVEQSNAITLGKGDWRAPGFMDKNCFSFSLYDVHSTDAFTVNVQGFNKGNGSNDPGIALFTNVHAAAKALFLSVIDQQIKTYELEFEQLGAPAQNGCDQAALYPNKNDE